jgi:site-specific DNA recombinase
MIAAYFRESSDPQEGNWSHQRQKTCFEAWLKTTGRTDFEIYDEVASSKVGAKRRVRWERMKENISEGNIDTVYFFKYARLGRDAEENESVKKLLKAHGVKFYEEESHSYLDLNSTSVDLLTSIAGKQAEIENETRRQNVVDGLKEQYDSGERRYTGKLYGFRSEASIVTKKGVEKISRKWFINEEEQEVILAAYRMALTGKIGLRAISGKLNTLGYRTRKGRLWTDVTVRGILTKPQYAGMTRDSNHELISSKVYPSIISEADYLRLKEKYPVYFTSKKRGRPNEKLSSALLVCAKCGARYRHFTAEDAIVQKDGTKVKGKKREKYYHKASIACGNQKMYIESVIDGLTLQIYWDALEAKKEILRNLHKFNETDEEVLKLSNLERQKTKIEKEVNNLKEAIKKGLNMEAVIPDINSGTSVILDIQKEIDSTKDSVRRKNEVLKAEEGFLQTLEMASLVKAQSDKERNTIIKRLVEKITLDEETIVATYVDGTQGIKYNYKYELWLRKFMDSQVTISPLPSSQEFGWPLAIREGIFRKLSRQFQTKDLRDAVKADVLQKLSESVGLLKSK